MSNELVQNQMGPDTVKYKASYVCWTLREDGLLCGVKRILVHLPGKSGSNSNSHNHIATSRLRSSVLLIAQSRKKSTL